MSGSFAGHALITEKAVLLPGCQHLHRAAAVGIDLAGGQERDSIVRMRVQPVVFILVVLFLAVSGRSSPVAPPPDAREARSGPGGLVQPIGPGSLSPDWKSPASTGAPRAWTMGTKQVLVIRVDFSDAPGEPVARDTATDVMNGTVRAFFERASYGQASIVGTITQRVYRMGAPRAGYAGSDAHGRLHAEASAAAAADHRVTDYDRVVVVYPRVEWLLSSAADIAGRRIWISSAAFTATVICRELGHTFGLVDSTVWSVSSRYGYLEVNSRVGNIYDPFDPMGSGSVEYDFNCWHKYHLGWIPEAAVTTVRKSGVYRIYRFDTFQASLKNPLALRVFRDGVRTYWIGFRAMAPSKQGEGAHLFWSHNEPQGSRLLNVNPSKPTGEEAALQVGAAFADPSHGISFRPVARGGSAEDEYMDIEITVPAAPPNVIAAWGSNRNTFYDEAAGRAVYPDPVISVPFGLLNVRDLAIGRGHVLALTANGVVTAWGLNHRGQATIPVGLKDVVSIAANFDVSGAVLRDGSIRVWGDGTWGLTKPPTGLNNVRQLALGTRHALALKTDGSVVAWGSPNYRATEVPAGLKRTIAVAAGDGSSIALHADGTFSHWGNIWGESFDTRGQLSAPVPWGVSGFTAISASGAHVLALHRDGKVWAWGSNSNGQCDVPAGLNDVVAIAAGQDHSLAVKADGTVVGWGHNSSGEVDIPIGLPGAHAVYAGGYASFALIGSGVQVTMQPRGTTVAAGTSATMNVRVASENQVTYQWRKDGVVLPGQTNATLTIAQPRTSDTGAYDVVITDGSRTTISFVAPLTVVMPLKITSQPESQTLFRGARIPLKVELVGGARPLRFRWRENGQLFSSFESPTAIADQVGVATYDVTITDGLTTVTSAPAYITVVSRARIKNLSIRAETGSGAQALGVGFVLGGGSGEGVAPLLVRGAGPALRSLGVSDTLADPKLELYRESTKIGENDNWDADAAVSQVGSALGAFAFAAGSRDAALYLPAVAPNAYSVRVSGTGEESGVVLAEIYDARQGDDFTASQPRLLNVSARGTLAGSSGRLMAGFFVSGNDTQLILFRAIGPTLSAFGVSGASANPRLEVFNADAMSVAKNDDWADVKVIKDAATAVGAFPLPSNSQDAAVMLYAGPGTYSVHVSGDPGIVLLEIYEVQTWPGP